MTADHIHLADIHLENTVTHHTTAGPYDSGDAPTAVEAHPVTPAGLGEVLAELEQARAEITYLRRGRDLALDEARQAGTRVEQLTAELTALNHLCDDRTRQRDEARADRATLVGQLQSARATAARAQAVIAEVRDIRDSLIGLGDDTTEAEDALAEVIDAYDATTPPPSSVPSPPAQDVVSVSRHDLTTVLDQRMLHHHQRPGRWDDDGSRCVECAARARLAGAIRAAETAGRLAGDDQPQAGTTRVEWGIRLTWAGDGTTEDMSRDTRDQAERTVAIHTRARSSDPAWQVTAELIQRTITTGPWVPVPAEPTSPADTRETP